MNAEDRFAPFIPRFGTRIGLELIEGKAGNIRDAVYLLSRYTAIEALDWLGRVMAHIYRSEAPAAPETQWSLVRGLCRGHLRDTIVRNPSRWDQFPEAVFFDDVQVLFALKLAIAHCVDGRPPAVGRGPGPLARALLAINDCILADTQQEVDNDGLLRVLLPEMFYRGQDEFLHAVARWECMLVRLPQKMGSSYPASYVTRLFREATGFDLTLYRAVAMALAALFSHVMRSHDINRRRPVLDRRTWIRNYRLSPAELAVVNSFQSTTRELKAEFAEAAPGTDAPYNFLPLRRRPIVAVGDAMWCFSMRFLHEKMTVGIYHEMLGYLGRAGRNKDSRELTSLRGKLFELYVEETLLRAYADGVASVWRTDVIWPDVQGEKADILIREGNTLLVIECKSHLFSQQVVVQADVEKFVSELQDIVQKGAQQIAATILALQDGSLVLPGSNSTPIRVYIPLIITLDRVPEGPLTADITDRYADAAGLTEIHQVLRRIQLVDIGTLEVIEPSIRSGQTLAHMARRKSLWELEHGSRISYRDFVSRLELPRRRNDFLVQLADEAMKPAIDFMDTRYAVEGDAEFRGIAGDAARVSAAYR